MITYNKTKISEITIFVNLTSRSFIRCFFVPLDSFLPQHDFFLLLYLCIQTYVCYVLVKDYIFHPLSMILNSMLSARIIGLFGR